MSGHTEAPWHWSNSYKTMDGRKTWSLIGADGYGVLSCDGEENSPQGVNDLPNASLITAAPRLLEALQAIVASLAEHDDEGMIEHAEQMIAARAVIAAATGEAE